MYMYCFLFCEKVTALADTLGQQTFIYKVSSFYSALIGVSHSPNTIYHFGSLRACLMAHGYKLTKLKPANHQK